MKQQLRSVLQPLVESGQAVNSYPVTVVCFMFKAKVLCVSLESKVTVRGEGLWGRGVWP